MIDQKDTPKHGRWYVYALILLAIFGASLALRVIPMYKIVFGQSWVNMQGVDGIYHLRLVQNLLAHFPFRISFDPYTYFPFGQDVYFAPLYDLLTGFCAWVVGLGSPSPHTIEVVAAYVPPVLGALVTIPVYFIGKALFNRTAGIIGAVVVGILPGTFLFRSRLGFFDHHIAEVFFSTLAIPFLLFALKYVKEHPIHFADIQNRNWKLVRRPLILAALSGLALGLYLIVWVGGLFFVFLLFVWAVAMFIIEHFRKQSSEYVCIISVPVFLVALIMVIPFLGQIAYSELYLFSLFFSLIVLFLLAVLSRLMANKNWAAVYYPLTLAAAGILGLVVIIIFFPSFANSIKEKFQIFTPNQNSLTISEVRPLLYLQGKFTLAPLWTEFTTTAIIAPLAFILLIVALVKKIDAGIMFLVIWAILMFVATTSQVRFAAYLAVVFAILSGYFYSESISWIKHIFDRIFKKSDSSAFQQVSRTRHKQKRQAKLASEKRASLQVRKRGLDGIRVAAIVLSVVVIFMAGIYPNIRPAWANAGTSGGINPEWRDSLLWMKANTPEPFSDPDYYYQRYKKPTSDVYAYPPSAYGVMAWWDYGHMITEIAHRIPNSNPNQYGAATAATFFISQQENAGNSILDSYGSRYIIVDYDIAIPYSFVNNTISGQKFYAMPTWAGQDPSQYSTIYYQLKNSAYTPVPVYFPAYYYCMSTRLYNFHGQAVVPQNSTTVVSTAVESGSTIIKSSQTFATYEEADAFLKKQTTGNYRIIGTSPFSSPVPLAKLDHYQEVYKSSTAITYGGQKTNSSYIEIFQYSH